MENRNNIGMEIIKNAALERTALIESNFFYIIYNIVLSEQFFIVLDIGSTLHQDKEFQSLIRNIQIHKNTLRFFCYVLCCLRILFKANN